MMNRKTRKKPTPISLEDAIASGMLRIITDPVERAELEAKERYDVSHTSSPKSRNDNYLKYSDTTYFAKYDDL
jgi:hypothetical protein